MVDIEKVRQRSDNEPVFACGVDQECGELVYGILICDRFIMPVDNILLNINRGYFAPYNPEYSVSPDIYEVMPDTIRIFTGLYSIFNKRLFAGDIVFRNNCSIIEYYKGDCSDKTLLSTNMGYLIGIVDGQPVIKESSCGMGVGTVLTQQMTGDMTLITDKYTHLGQEIIEQWEKEQV